MSVMAISRVNAVASPCVVVGRVHVLSGPGSVHALDRLAVVVGIEDAVGAGDLHRLRAVDEDAAVAPRCAAAPT